MEGVAKASLTVYLKSKTFFLQVSCSRDDLLLLYWFIWVYFLFIIKYLKLFIIENTILIFQFYFRSTAIVILIVIVIRINHYD
jgi:hypothetical protein